MTQILEIPQTLARKALEYWRNLGVRVALMGALAVFAMALTQPVEWLLPEQAQTRLAGSAADRLLDIIANAMLAVTTFSLTVMVAVFSNVSTQWTPRIHRLAMEDDVTLHTLATFIGAWVFALMGIVLRELGVFPDDKATALFGVTVLVLAYVAWSVVRWVLHLQTFGSLLSSTRDVEQITCDGLQERFDMPCLGAVPFTEALPKDATTLCANDTGYVQMIYQEALNAYCDTHNLTLWLLVEPGDFVSLNAPLVAVQGEVPDDFADCMGVNVLLGDVRTHDQDPRFGLVILAEIASKALSPGVNDPGTAIDVITRAERVLALYADETKADTALYPNLRVAPLDPAELIQDIFAPISRDGATQVEVQIRLQKSVRALIRHPDPALSKAAKAAAQEYLDRAMAAIEFEPDQTRMSQITPEI